MIDGVVEKPIRSMFFAPLRDLSVSSRTGCAAVHMLTGRARCRLAWPGGPAQHPCMPSSQPSAAERTIQCPCGSRRLGAMLALVLLVPCASAMGVGCGKVTERPICVETRLRARQAAEHGRTKEASALLDKARAACGRKSDVYIQSIEKLIADKVEEEGEVARQQALRRREQEQYPARQFLAWVKAHRDEVTGEVEGQSCAPRGSADHGFCQGHRPGFPASSVRFWDADRQAFRFSLATEAPLGCEDLGDHRRVGSWSMGGTSYTLCEPTEHELRSLSALLVRAPKRNELFVFSQAYLQRDEEFRRLLNGGR